jgi:hypothetical protein
VASQSRSASTFGHFFAAESALVNGLFLTISLAGLMTVRSDVRFVPCGQLDYELVGGSSGAQNHPFRTGSEPVPNRDVGLEHPELLGGRCRGGE